ncbi:DUF3732 domain-containing protein [Radiobacillus sp. PE A8.2]|uniref:DUF3732 domain-containing protein n=1 Tax=Radiobacillus sp. PE A8.2 TaxID=3380349 RepID=UPI00388EADD5
MYFQFLKLIIWPKSKRFHPRTVEFKPGVVNVITGASRTGKSAIIPIIDYCLASSDCSIPIDTIRDNASWYGVVFKTEVEQILLCRKVPDGNKVSNEFYLYRGINVDIPPFIENGNEKFENVKHILNTISAVPYLELGNENENNAYQRRLSFRDLMAFTFQNQDIVANQNILFYKTHAYEHRERLKNWFPFILGAETLETLVARHRFKVVEKQLNHTIKEYEKLEDISSGWKLNLLSQIKVAIEYGITEETVNEQISLDELIEISRDIVGNIPYYSHTDINDIETSNKEIIELEEEEDLISENIAKLKKRLSDVDKLKTGLSDYGSSVRKRVERLHISQWLEDISLEAEKCPTCGSYEHPNKNNEISRIAAEFKKYEAQSRKLAEVPTSFNREEERLKLELKVLLQKKDRNQKRFDLLLAKDKEAQRNFHRKKNMYLFLGQLKTSLETFESLTDGGELQIRIDTLREELDELFKSTDPGGIERKIENATLKIAQGILNHLQLLDVEDKYRQVAPRFSIKDLNVSVLSNDNHWHFLSEVGSASNWVSFHIAMMCSLHEYFLNLKESYVPSFVIFDQPSQVYFPKLKKYIQENEGDPEFDNEDIEAVKKMFKTMAKSIKNSNGRWQAIVLDHADGDVYGDIEEVHEVEVWRDGEKLIPTYWYN